MRQVCAALRTTGPQPYGQDVTVTSSHFCVHALWEPGGSAQAVEDFRRTAVSADAAEEFTRGSLSPRERARESILSFTAPLVKDANLTFTKESH